MKENREIGEREAGRNRDAEMLRQIRDRGGGNKEQEWGQRIPEEVRRRRLGTLKPSSLPDHTPLLPLRGPPHHSL